MPKKTAKESDRRKLGKHSAYEILEDGRIRVWPCYSDRFLEINDSLAALEQLTDQIARFVTAERQALSKQSRRVWDEMGDDFGMNFKPGCGWSFDFSKNHLMPPPPTEPQNPGDAATESEE